MSPEELNRRITFLESELQKLKSASQIPYDVDQAFRARLKNFFLSDDQLPDGFSDAPLALITSPSGGATIDSQARTAIDTIITRLENLGLVSPN